ncbi:MAG: ATP-binding protein [Alphaproteobacteria bacterium]|nr:MAG: ATP-binding protein [Alphaproteobacteria bacterium]
MPSEDIKFRHALITALRSMGEEIGEEVDEPDEFQILQFAHHGKGGRKVFFEIEDESDGTLRLLTLLDPVFTALETGGSVIIDELEASLHTEAASAILRLFLSKKTNPHGAQLIATTHNTNLLNTEELRRDMVWFVEKDEEGASHLYPLSDFRTRKEWNIERGYLQGRFGAIPFCGGVERLIGELEEWEGAGEQA